MDRSPVIGPGQTLATVTDRISAVVLTRKTTRGWLLGFAISFALLILLQIAIGHLLMRGIGIWGVNQPVGWGRGHSGGRAAGPRDGLGIATLRLYIRSRCGQLT